MVLHALIDGLIANWVLDTSYHPLAQDAEVIVDGYLAGLKALPMPASPIHGAAPIDANALRNAPLGFGCAQSRAAQAGACSELPAGASAAAPAAPADTARKSVARKGVRKTADADVAATAVADVAPAGL